MTTADAAAPTWASASKPMSSSACMRSSRAASVSVEITPASPAAKISSSDVVGMRGSTGCWSVITIEPSGVGRPPGRANVYGARKAIISTPARSSALGRLRAYGWSSAVSSPGLAITNAVTRRELRTR